MYAGSGYTSSLQTTDCPNTDTSLQRSKHSLPRETTRVTRLFGRSTTAREGWLQQPTLHEVFNYFLRTETIPYHDPNSLKLSTDPILSSAATLDIGPGVKAQGLHRDDFIWQQTHTVPKERYSAGSDVSMGLLVPGVDTTAENGATLVKLSAAKIGEQDGLSTNLTQFVPGSHLWDDSRPPKEEEVVSAKMSVGEAFLFLGSTVHAGGTNTTSQSRPMHGFFYCRSFIRPEVCNYYPWHLAAGFFKKGSRLLLFAAVSISADWNDRKISTYGGPRMRFGNGLLQLKNKRGILLAALSLAIAMTAILLTYFGQMMPV